MFEYIGLVAILSIACLVGFIAGYSHKKEKTICYIQILEDKIRNLKYSIHLRDSTITKMMQQIVDIIEIIEEKK